MNKSLLKLSKDNAFLVAYFDIDNFERFYVYNTLKNEKLWEGKLDLSSNIAIREDPVKLILLSYDSHSLFIRGRDKKKIAQHSLQDGQVITESKQLHTNYIKTFLITKDEKKLITAGIDRKIKIWNWIK